MSDVCVILSTEEENTTSLSVHSVNIPLFPEATRQSVYLFNSARSAELKCLKTLYAPGIPRHLDPQDGYLRREAKQMKRESSPPRGPGSISDPMKGRDGIVPTVKEAGRSIHLIPRDELRQSAKEGMIAQVYSLTTWFYSAWIA